MQEFYHIEKVSDYIYQITSKENTNCQLIVGTEKALLFDTGYGIGNLAEEVKKITSLPVIVVNSHGHLDHINGNNQFEGTIYIHEADLALAGNHSCMNCRAGAVENAKHTPNFLEHTEENILPEGFDADSYIHATMPEWTFVEEGHTFDLGGITLEVIHFPGHTVGSIGLWDAQDKILFIGDAFGPFTWLFADEASTLSEYTKTLYKAKALEPKFMLAGHALMPLRPVDLEYYIDCAEHVDFEKGVPFQNNILPGADARVCVREGFQPMQFDKEGYASVVISEAHLK